MAVSLARLLAMGNRAIHFDAVCQVAHSYIELVVAHETTFAGGILK